MYILVHVCMYTKDVNLSLFVSKFVFTFLSSFDKGQFKLDVLLFFSESVVWLDFFTETSCHLLVFYCKY